MKLLAATVLLAALVPAAPSGPTLLRGAAEHRAMEHRAAEHRAAEHGALEHGSAGDCVHPEARLRTGGHGRERNDLTPAQAATVEQRLNRILDGLGLSLGADDQSDAADLRPQAAVTIPVYFHVIHDGTRGNVSTAEVKRQISTMNASYGGRNGGADTGITFTLREITRSDNAAWFQDPERYEGTYKPQLHRGDKGTLNLYSTHIGGNLLGWSTFPWKYANDPQMDGVTIHYGSMPGGTIENFNRGFSATHEVGHWLGLYHTFQDGCGGMGDRVADTPSERDPSNGCPTGKDTCPSPGADPVHNYMDYGYDTCMTSFTAGQGARMHKVWKAYRA